MSDHRLMIFPCEYESYPCASFTCNEPTTEKYWVANPYSGGIHTYPIFCRACIENLVSHIPPELSPDGGAVEARLRAELDEQYAKTFDDQLHQAEARLRQEITEKLVREFSKPEVTEIPTAVTVEVEEANKMGYRCLDCGSDFETAVKLADHKVTHDPVAPPKNKGGRPPKAKQ